MYFVPTPDLQDKTTVFPRELAELLTNSAVRQLCIFRREDGWMLQVLTTWKPEFHTLVQHSKRREIRYYTSLDRLLSSITRSATTLPPILVFGDNE